MPGSATAPECITQDFELRRQIYENRDAFYAIAGGEDGAPLEDLPDKAELEAIALHTETGKGKLLAALQAARALRAEQHHVDGCIAELACIARDAQRLDATLEDSVQRLGGGLPAPMVD